MIKGEREAAEQILVLDTGDALRGGGILGDTTDGKAIVAAMNLVGTDAMALGLNELSLGSAELLKRMAEAEFPILSANVLLTGTTESFAPGYTVVDVAGHRVGLLGLTRPPAARVADFVVRDPVSTAAMVLPELMQQAETIILLTNMEYRPAMELVAVVPGIDLVIAADPGQLPTDVAVVRGTNSIAVAAEQPVARHTGRRVGRLQVTITSDGKLSGATWRSISLDKTFADDPAMAALLDGFRQ